MSVDYHRHCQYTVLAANGTGEQNGETWNAISELELPNLGSDWIDNFKSNTSNITQDFAAILKLIDGVAGNSKAGRNVTLKINNKTLNFNTMKEVSGETKDITIDVGTSGSNVTVDTYDVGVDKVQIATIKVDGSPKTIYAPKSSSSGSTTSVTVMSNPVGTIIQFGGNDALPQGYLLCDGSEVSKTEYPELYSVIGNTYGTASSGKFKLPLLTDARYLQGNTRSGDYIAAGLPNITGELSELRKYKTETLVKSGAFETSSGVTNKTMTTGQITGETGVNIVFNASKSSKIYGKSDSVTPKSMTIRYLICAKKVEDSSVKDAPSDIPIGTIISKIGKTTPVGFLLCDGSYVSKTTYSKLYEEIGNAFGETSETFMLPNLTDERYLQGSNTSGTYVDAGLPNITGSINGLSCESAGSHSHTYNKIEQGDWDQFGHESFSHYANDNDLNTGTSGSHTHTIDGNNISITGGTSSVYGKSDSVTPKSMTVQYYIYCGE